MAETTSEARVVDRPPGDDASEEERVLIDALARFSEAVGREEFHRFASHVLTGLQSDA